MKCLGERASECLQLRLSNIREERDTQRRRRTEQDGRIYYKRVRWVRTWYERTRVVKTDRVIKGVSVLTCLGVLVYPASAVAWGEGAAWRRCSPQLPSPVNCFSDELYDSRSH
ncbi:hypothetical protein Pcinc_025508 [Petrolisthes cinctipes]|uniref:Uncharacterized protein n=1 Tax=Petrolisthes cinctipes TaxID=88211 RepID=A0AAE1F8E1_PETCI|nr:hypothetical protein Pcinc_025508 [Petrolisthes cinctipes]